MNDSKTVDGTVLKLTAHPHPASQFTYPLPYGAVVHDSGVQFIVFSRSATAMRLLLYSHQDDPEPTEVIHFDRKHDRWGDVWSIFVPGIPAGTLYHFQADGPWDPEHGQRFDGMARLIDPYARALCGRFLPAADGIIRPPKCVVVDDHFDWEGDRHPRRSLRDTVIYEMHVRGFTRDGSSGVAHPGTYLGVIEKIPYLKSLGVTAVELMPVHEFPMQSPYGHELVRPNYWGYDSLAFFAPHQGYAVGKEPGAPVHEFKQMVKALHDAGIEVILDVVFNHTAEGNERGPTLSFKGLENRVYYMLGNGGSYYRNYSGCGNTVNGNHPIVRELIFLCLRYWVNNYHIDGFRFDLASILSRDRSGELAPNPPLIERIAEDPLLADTKLIAEAWDAAGAYQVGSFGQLRWAEWNGRYRDDVRRYWRGDAYQIGPMATRIAGSADLYQAGGRNPYHSINFITSHDGFPLSDLVSYSYKHNELNGEGNRDGDNNNLSDNNGKEGPTTSADIEARRLRQVKNFLATLLLSQGVPMLLSGDECRRTQQGNNNAYCQDNKTSWFDWSLVKTHADLVRFVSALIKLRLENPTLRRLNFLRGDTSGAACLPDVSWFSAEGTAKIWEQNDPSLICVFGAPADAETNGIWKPATKPGSLSPLQQFPKATHTGLAAPPGSNGAGPAADGEKPAIVPAPSSTQQPRHVMLLLHAGDSPRTFTIPTALRGLGWRKFLDTSADSPHDIYPSGDGPRPPRRGQIELEGRSLVCYLADCS